LNPGVVEPPVTNGEKEVFGLELPKRVDELPRLAKMLVAAGFVGVASVTLTVGNALFVGDDALPNLMGVSGFQV
jgi:hypothetical protein